MKRISLERYFLVENCFSFIWSKKLQIIKERNAFFSDENHEKNPFFQMSNRKIKKKLFYFFLNFKRKKKKDFLRKRFDERRDCFTERLKGSKLSPFWSSTTEPFFGSFLTTLDCGWVLELKKEKNFMTK